ncbi:hypothetical protein [Streptomyces sp. TRM75563]|uniref:hypothetical protein n=1 Tax=Streptomyces sp. TRM75563 TaxID=2817418 RepID=UPI001F611C59|nr:hypothetical protein [Streptomyces sp. TRM75563]MCI4045465.1 hypothetical protein [Streptomyces sp. TRM75563]
MEIAELVLKYVEALIWPVATVALVWGLRTPIGRAIGRLSRLETPAGTAEFSAEARNVLDEAEEITEAARVDFRQVDEAVAQGEPERELPARAADTAAEDRLQPEQYEEARSAIRHIEVRLRQLTAQNVVSILQEMRGDAFASASEMAAASPAGAVITAWARLETMCLNAMEQRLREGAAGDVGPMPRVVKIRRGLLAMGATPEVLHIYERLRRLRGQAIREPEAVSVEAATYFVDSCRTVAEAIQGGPGEVLGTPGSP